MLFFGLCCWIGEEQVLGSGLAVGLSLGFGNDFGDGFVMVL